MTTMSGESKGEQKRYIVQQLLAEADADEGVEFNSFTAIEKPINSLSRALGLLILADTYAYARTECEHYRHYPLEQIRSYSDLTTLPIIDRKMLESDLLAFCATGRAVFHYSTTSGTTTGQSLFIPRTHEEREALRQYRNLTLPSDSKGDASRRLMLRLLPGGRLIPGPAGSSSELIGVYHLNMARENLWDNWDYLIGQLFAKFPVRWHLEQINLIHATPPCGLVMLTRYMLARGINPSDTAVRSLVVTGGWISRHTRTWLEAAWNAELATSYSCAEMNGWANECRLNPCKYHFNHTVYPEVVFPHTGELVVPGEQGRLLLTGAYPFHQACMLMRYAVGDWVRWIGNEPCTCGVTAPTVEFLGREQTVCFVELDDGTALPLSSVPILEALDPLPYIPDIPRPQYRYVVQKQERRPHVTLNVECFTVGDKLWQKRAEQEIQAALFTEQPEVRAAVEKGQIDFSIHLHTRSGLTVNIGMR
jgi:phenylacetate-coenzyme A ligase PaaK-like adenylate-forming protein